MKKLKILLNVVLFVLFGMVFVQIAEACTVGTSKCESGALWDCKSVCTAEIAGICYDYSSEWVKRVNCIYGACLNSSTCAQCNSNDDCDSGKACISYTCKTMVNGDCGSLKNTCDRGTFKDTTDTSTNYRWDCVGSNGGSTASCSVLKPLCGSAAGTLVDTKPSGTAACSPGTVGTVSGTETFNWSCYLNGGNVSCSATASCILLGGQCYTGNGICPTDGFYGVFVNNNTCTNGGVCCSETDCESDLNGTCQTSAWCSAVGGSATLTSDCNSVGKTCCIGERYSDECSGVGVGDAFCEYNYGSSCYKCVDNVINGVHINYVCESVPTSGVCSGSDGDSECFWSGVSPTCASGTPTITDSNGSDGYFNWTCSASCGGTADTCSVVNLPTINGSCGTADGDNLTARPTTNLCNNGTANWSMTGTDSEGTDGTFDWKCTGSCGGSTDTCSAVNDLIPNITIDPIDIIDPDGVALTADAQGRNHSCEVDYGSGTVYQFLVTVTDANGLSDIDTVTLRFRPDSGNTVTTAAVIPNASGVATFNVDITGLEYKTYNLEVQAKDKHDPPGESSWMDTGRDFKVWDCLVGVNGTVYDGSADAGSISCSGNVGYTNTIPAASVFTLGYFLGTESPRMMTVSSPTFVDGGNKLYWNSPINYQSIFQDLPGSDPTQMRVNDSTCVSGVTLDPKLADPYAVSPSLKVEYSSVLDQDSWFSVVDGSVISAGKVINYVPVTCLTNCKTTINGVVLQSDPSSGLSNYDVTDSKFTGKSVNTGSYSYSILEPKYYSTLGIGTTITGSKKWSEINTSTGIIFVSGNLEIDENIAGSDFKVIITSGSITIDENVTQVKSTLMASSITAGGESNTPLTITGSLYSSGSVILSRSFSTKADNNETPSVKIVYDPRIIFNMPKELAKSVTQWKLN